MNADRAAVEAAVEAATQFRDAWHAGDVRTGSGATFLTLAEDGTTASLTEPQLTTVLAELKRLGRVEQERDGATVWTDWMVSVHFTGGAVSVDFEDETDARIRYRELTNDWRRADRLVANSSYTTGRASKVELLSRTNVQGSYRSVEYARGADLAARDEREARA